MDQKIKNESKVNEKTNDGNATDRKSYVGTLYKKSVNSTRKDVLKKYDKKNLHELGEIHIHELAEFELTYNCMTVSLTDIITSDIKANNANDYIYEVIENLRIFIGKITNEQSGGIAIANFDMEMEELFKQNSFDDFDIDVVIKYFRNFNRWLTVSRERYGTVSYYFSFNTGLSTTALGMKFNEALLKSYIEDESYYKPNIIIKLRDGVNKKRTDPAYQTKVLAAKSTAKKMIPTYLNTDAELNKDVDPKEIAIVGCRSRVYANIIGKPTSVNRGNFANITINIPNIAYNNDKEDDFFKELSWKMDYVRDILLERFKIRKEWPKANFPTSTEFDIRKKDYENWFDEDTLAIGFIGLDEAITHMNKPEEFKSSILEFMLNKSKNYINEYNLNFSILGSAAESVCGRFAELDSKRFNVKNDYYTNSFHIPVSNKMSLFDKINTESKYHKYCNGGCITYVELSSPPNTNHQAVLDLLDEIGDCHYLGVNFPLDICVECGSTSMRNVCKCGCEEFVRLRRVSGYLEKDTTFLKGKRAELKDRVNHD